MSFLISYEVLGATFGAGFGLGGGVLGSLVLSGALNEEGKKPNYGRMAVASVVSMIVFSLIFAKIGGSIDSVS